MFKIKLSSKLALCTLSAFLIASTIFLAVHKIGALWIEDKFEDTSFAEQQEYLEIQSFQEYINKKQLSALDYHWMSRWVEERQLTTLFLYYGDRLIYDSSISYHA